MYIQDNYVVQVAETGFFADMSIELSDQAKSALDRIADVIRRTGLNRVLLHAPGSSRWRRDVGRSAATS
ncbi:MAG: hypothetical protein HC933_22030 [Pleurocapsa sp. SU_196_0]|nr:hypothetical protein [Pleurocapsa sp. SU_196_0]